MIKRVLSDGAVPVMPGVHAGDGSTVGSVTPTKAAFIPAAAGVDTGCGRLAQRLSLTAKDLPDDLAAAPFAIVALAISRRSLLRMSQVLASHYVEPDSLANQVISSQKGTTAYTFQRWNLPSKNRQATTPTSAFTQGTGT